MYLHSLLLYFLGMQREIQCLVYSGNAVSDKLYNGVLAAMSKAMIRVRF